MALEDPTHISDLVATNPVGATDPKSQGDDHIRNMKTVMKTDFPDVDAPTASFFMSATAPANPVAGTRWWDTTAGLLKRRNAANTDWITSAISATANNTVDIDGGTIDGATLTGNTITTGTIDDTPIGATTENTGKFTTLQSTGDATVGGSIIVTGTVDGRDVAADGARLDGIETAADLTPTGVVDFYIGTTAPSGWVMGEGGTIGNASSGGSERANADTENLFTLLWDSMTDTEAPVSSGRGANAAADFAANKTITLPEVPGRSLIGSGTGSGLTLRTHGAQLGSEDLIAADIPPLNVTVYLSSTGATPTVAVTLAGSTQQLSRVNSGGNGTGSRMQPSLALNAIIKL